MKEYKELLAEVLAHGRVRSDRTGTGTRGVFGRQMRIDLSKGFPALTTKRIHMKSVIHELLWFLKGDTNIKYLKDNGVRIWDEWRQPYTLSRPFVKVPRVEHPSYAAYDGDFSFAGANAQCDSEDGKLLGAWKHMMRRCYDPNHHRYAVYGGVGAFVCAAWHDPATFIQDVKELPHWRYKRDDWNRFELDKDYYGTKCYAPHTCMWLRKDENVSGDGVILTDPEGVEYVFPSYSAAADGVGASTSSLHRFVTEGLPTILKGNNKKFAGWEFRSADDDPFVVRRQLIHEGDLGPVYGSQWRSWQSDNGTIDQIANVIESLKKDPFGRRHIVTAWNPAEVDKMALPPCHLLFQFHVEELNAGERVVVLRDRRAADGETAPLWDEWKDDADLHAKLDDIGIPRHRLNCQLYQRSADIFLGVPFNIASYSLLTMMVAQVCNMVPGDFVHTFGDLHIYSNHMDQVREQLSREPLMLPRMRLNPEVKNIDDFVYEDFTLEGYDPMPTIKAPVAV